MNTHVTSRQAHIPRAIAVIATLLIAQASTEASIDWTIEEGWLTAHAAGMPIAEPGTGPAVDLMVNDKPLIGVRKTAPRVTSTPDGGFEITYALDSGSLVDRYEPSCLPRHSGVFRASSRH